MANRWAISIWEPRTGYRARVAAYTSLFQAALAAVRFTVYGRGRVLSWPTTHPA